MFRRGILMLIVFLVISFCALANDQPAVQRDEIISPKNGATLSFSRPLILLKLSESSLEQIRQSHAKLILELQKGSENAKPLEAYGYQPITVELGKLMGFQLNESTASLESDKYLLIARVQIQEQLTELAKSEFQIQTKTLPITPIKPPKPELHPTQSLINKKEIGITGTVPNATGIELFVNGKFTIGIKQVTPPSGLIPSEKFSFDSVKLEDGRNIIEAVAIDADGNRSERSEPLEILVNVSPPSVRILSPTQLEKLDNIFEISAEAKDDNGLTKESLKFLVGTEGKGFSEYLPTQLEGDIYKYMATHGWADGTYVVKAQAQDKAGNVSVSPEVSFLVVRRQADSQPPQIEFLELPSELTNKTYLSLKARIWDNLSIKEEALRLFVDGEMIPKLQTGISDGHVYNKETKELSYRRQGSLGPGEHEVRLYAEDENQNRNEAKYKFVIDLNRPTATILSHNNNAIFKEPTIDVIWSLDTDGEAELWLNSQQLRPKQIVIADKQYVFERIALQEGKNLIALKVWNKAGNSSETQVAVRRDMTPPKIQNVQPDSGKELFQELDDEILITASILDEGGVDPRSILFIWSYDKFVEEMDFKDGDPEKFDNEGGGGRLITNGSKINLHIRRILDEDGNKIGFDLRFSYRPPMGNLNDEYKLLIKAKDLAGNEAVPYQGTFKVDPSISDTVPPEVRFKTDSIQPTAEGEKIITNHKTELKIAADLSDLSGLEEVRLQLKDARGNDIDIGLPARHLPPKDAGKREGYAYIQALPKTLKDGEYLLILTVTDRSKNRNVSQYQFKLEIDSEPPKPPMLYVDAKLINPKGQKFFTNKSQIVIEVKPQPSDESERKEKIEVRLLINDKLKEVQKGTAQRPYSFSLELIKGSPALMAALIADEAGNLSDSTMTELVLDQDRPNIRVLSPASAGGCLTEPNPLILLKCSDISSEVEVESLKASLRHEGSGTSIPLKLILTEPKKELFSFAPELELIEGDYLIVASVSDKAGNIETLEGYPFCISLQPSRIITRMYMEEYDENQNTIGKVKNRYKVNPNPEVFGFRLKVRSDPKAAGDYVLIIRVNQATVNFTPEEGGIPLFNNPEVIADVGQYPLRLGDIGLFFNWHSRWKEDEPLFSRSFGAVLNAPDYRVKEGDKVSIVVFEVKRNEFGAYRLKYQGRFSYEYISSHVELHNSVLANFIEEEKEGSPFKPDNMGFTLYYQYNGHSWWRRHVLWRLAGLSVSYYNLSRPAESLTDNLAFAMAIRAMGPLYVNVGVKRRDWEPFWGISLTEKMLTDPARLTWDWLTGRFKEPPAPPPAKK